VPLLHACSFRQQLLRLHAKKALQMLAVDEAHCISSWGHDFRPSYRQLAQLRQQLRGLPCMALTATATQQVRLLQ
jgi:bloom syndrome protein